MPKFLPTDIPVFDIELFANADDHVRREMGYDFVTALHAGCLVGFCNHPAGHLNENLPDFVHNLFSRPLTPTALQGIDTTRGYCQGFRDQMMWHTGPEYAEDQDHPFADRLPENHWFDDWPEFQAITMEVYGVMEDLSRYLMSLLALGLDADEQAWSEAMVYHNSVLRYLYYPANGDFIMGDQRLGSHIDPGMFAIIPTATGGGFQFMFEDIWIEPEIAEGIIYCYPGQITEYLTNGYIKAIYHRVVAIDDLGENERLSYPFFMVPHPDFKLTPPASVVGAKGADYPELAAGEVVNNYFKDYLATQYESQWVDDFMEGNECNVLKN